MKKTGQLLKDKRESANLSLSEVALATKINPKILTAIELGEEKNLPAKTFLKGFLRSYALFLKLDAEEVLRLYMEETGAPPPEQKPVEPAKPAAPASGGRRKIAEENSSGLRTAAVIVIVMLIGVIIGVRELIEKYQREKVLESAEIKVSPLEQPPAVPAPAPGTPPVVATPPPVEGAPPAASQPAEPAMTTPSPAITTAAPTPAPSTPPTPAPSTPPVAAPAPAPDSVAPSAPAPAPVPIVATPPSAEPKKDEVKKPEEAKKPEEPKKTEAAAPESPVKNVKSEIILEALDKVDVKIQIKGETKKLSLGPTQVHTIRAEQPVIFDFSDGGAVNIILNGRERGPAGELGKPKQLKIP